jgi:hypothetical protein
MAEYRCEVCGNAFRSYNPRPRFCSLECKGVAQRAGVDVSRIREMYNAGHTQAEIARALDTTQKVVHGAMKRAGIPTRKATKRDQWRENNPQWKGDEASYTAFHHRVERARDKPLRCDECGTTDPEQAYDWANLTGDYGNVEDYRRMCRSCHWKYDGRVENLRGGA